MSFGLDDECARVEARGVRLRRFEMGAEALELAGPNFNNVRRRKAVFEHSFATHGQILKG